MARQRAAHDQQLSSAATYCAATVGAEPFGPTRPDRFAQPDAGIGKRRTGRDTDGGLVSTSDKRGAAHWASLGAATAGYVVPLPWLRSATDDRAGAPSQ